MQIFIKEDSLALNKNTDSSHSKINAYWHTLTYIFAGVGSFLRTFHFFDNRSLWTDEMYLSVSLLKMNFIELATQPLYFQQKAPIGFLWLIKAGVQVFGKGEMALRIIPLVTGIAAIYLFIYVSRHFLKYSGTAVATGILSLSPYFVYHSVEIKQYGVELFCTILILFLYLKYYKKTDIRSLIKWGIGGAAILWFSYSAIFVLVGMAIALSLYDLLRKEWKSFFNSILPFSIWAVSFLINFFLFIYEHTESEWLIYWFRIRDSFIPFPPTSTSDMMWLIQIPYKLLYYPLGLLWDFVTTSNTTLRIILRMSFIPLICWGVGMVSFYKKNLKLFMVLLFPLLLTLAASSLERYPFYERLTLFLSPLLILFIAKGFQVIIKKLPSKPFLAYTLAFLLLVGPAANSGAQLLNTDLFGGYKKNYQRECWLYINDRYQDGDAVYVYWNIRYGYQFHKNSYNLKYNAIEGKDHRPFSKNGEDYLQKLRTEIEILRKHKRVWLIYERDYWLDIGDFEGQPVWYYKNHKLLQQVTEEFIALGKQVDVHETEQGKIILIDLN